MTRLCEGLSDTPVDYLNYRQLKDGKSALPKAARATTSEFEISTNWRRVMTRFKDAPKWASFPRPGYWNDLDSLEIGDGPHDGLNIVQKQSAMTLWCISCAPLFTGADLTHLDQDADQP